MNRSLPLLAVAGVLVFSSGCQHPAPATAPALDNVGLPTLPVVPGPDSGHIDRVNGVVAGSAPLTGRAGEPVTVFGWALDAAQKELAAEVYVEIAGQGFRAQYFEPRPDVGKTFGGKEPLNYAGFSATIAGGQIPAGETSMRLHIVNHARSGQYVTTPLPFSVRP